MTPQDDMLPFAREAHVTCPDCKGKKKTVMYGCPGFRRMEGACLTCDGAGDLPEGRAKQLHDARQVREMRAGKIGIFQLAKRTGLLVSTVSEFERGRLGIVRHDEVRAKIMAVLESLP